MTGKRGQGAKRPLLVGYTGVLPTRRAARMDSGARHLLVTSIG